MVETLVTIVFVSGLFLLCYMLGIAVLCISNSKECYQCGERLESYNIKKYRISSNKGFCGSHCKDIHERDLLSKLDK